MSGAGAEFSPVSGGACSVAWGPAAAAAVPRLAASVSDDRGEVSGAGAPPLRAGAGAAAAWARAGLEAPTVGVFSWIISIVAGGGWWSGAPPMCRASAMRGRATKAPTAAMWAATARATKRPVPASRRRERGMARKKARGSAPGPRRGLGPRPHLLGPQVQDCLCWRGLRGRAPLLS